MPPYWPPRRRRVPKPPPSEGWQAEPEYLRNDEAQGVAIAAPKR
jgi:hypothetical protein